MYNVTLLSSSDRPEFVVAKYTQGDTDKGFVLGSTEDVVMLLDDNAMSLQSMTASRFVGPFVDQVQLWEKRLSNVAEVIDVWVVVQRKWMYLESIFLAGDIRQQLPNEARKFEGIDKAFKVNVVYIPRYIYISSIFCIKFNGR